MPLQAALSKLTEIGHHYIDWARVGEIFRSGNLNYSPKMLFDRGVVVLITTATTYFFSREEFTENTGLSQAQAIGLGVGVGLTLAHIPTVGPLIYKRKKCEWACQQEEHKLLLLIERLKNILNKEPIFTELAKNITGTAHEIMQLSLSTERRGNASQTWGKRKRLMQELVNTVEIQLNDIENNHNNIAKITQFWQQSKKDIMEWLDNYNKKEKSAFISLSR